MGVGNNIMSIFKITSKVLSMGTITMTCDNCGYYGAMEKSKQNTVATCPKCGFRNDNS